MNHETGTGKYEHLLERCKSLAPVPTAVVYPCEQSALAGAVEAAACGLPIVTTDWPGCRDIVEDGYNGLLVPIGDADALAAALGRTLADPAFASRLAERGLETVREHYSWDKVTRQYVQLYSELVGWH